MTDIAEGGFPNLANWAARHNPDGSIADFINILSKKVPVLDDIPFVQGNLPTGHRITQTANSLPSGTWRQINGGVDPVKGETAQYDETCGMLETEAKIDVDLAELNGDAAAYRAGEEAIISEGLMQQVATAVFYESAVTNPTRIHGLTPRYAATTGYTASSYVMKSITSGVDGQSIWLITWEPRKLYGIYPKGSQAGLQIKDEGEQRVLDSNSKAFRAWCTWFQWKLGIAVEDYRYAVRFQWDPDTAANADTGKGVYTAMQDMLSTIYEITPNTRFYMNRTSKKKLDTQLASNSANFLEYIESGGKRIPAFMGVPIRVTDSLVAETIIS